MLFARLLKTWNNFVSGIDKFPIVSDRIFVWWRFKHTHIHTRAHFTDKYICTVNKVVQVQNALKLLSDLIALTTMLAVDGCCCCCWRCWCCECWTINCNIVVCELECVEFSIYLIVKLHYIEPKIVSIKVVFTLLDYRFIFSCVFDTGTKRNHWFALLFLNSDENWNCWCSSLTKWYDTTAHNTISKPISNSMELAGLNCIFRHKNWVIRGTRYIECSIDPVEKLFFILHKYVNSFGK